MYLGQPKEQSCRELPSIRPTPPQGSASLLPQLRCHHNLSRLPSLSPPLLDPPSRHRPRPCKSNNSKIRSSAPTGPTPPSPFRLCSDRSRPPLRWQMHRPLLLSRYVPSSGAGVASCLIFELDTIAIFAEFYWPEQGMCLFLVLPGYPTNKSRDARILEANCKHISNGINAQPIFISCLTPCIVFVHHISNCQATPKEVAQQQPPPPQTQQLSGEGAAFNNSAPMAAPAPGYPYAMTNAAAVPGAQGMSFIMQVREFNSYLVHTAL